LARISLKGTRLVTACDGFIINHSGGIAVIVDRADQAAVKVKWKGRGETKTIKLTLFLNQNISFFG
jgi:hypothetical protein